MIDDDLARAIRRHAPLVGAVREAYSTREADIVRGPGRHVRARALEPVHQPGHLREWILDLMSRAAAIDGFPPAADALHATALDLDHHHAQIRVANDDIRLAILGLCSRPLLEPGHVAIHHVRRLQSLPKRHRQWPCPLEWWDLSDRS